MEKERKTAGDKGEGLLFPKTPTRKKKMRHPKSVMHSKESRTCYLCMNLHNDCSLHQILHEHHVFEGTANRQQSEQYGLKVYLCPEHHLYGEESAHGNKMIAEYLHKAGQEAFERTGTREEFQKIFGKNYL